MTARRRRAPTSSRARTPSRIRTLAIDIGGSGIKGSVLDARGRMVNERVKIDTPEEPSRRVLLRAIERLVKQVPKFDRAAVGFPGVVRNGVIRSAANLSDKLIGLDLGRALEKRFDVPVEVINDADMQGYGAIRGRGVELVITLGTGFGTSIFVDGRLGPHLELAHHPWKRGKTYEELLGNEARKRAGNGRWKKRVFEAIEELRDLTAFDHLYIGGGNSRRLVDEELPEGVHLVDNAAGILGGIRVFGDELGRY